MAEETWTQAELMLLHAVEGDSTSAIMRASTFTRGLFSDRLTTNTMKILIPLSGLLLCNLAAFSQGLLVTGKERNDDRPLPIYRLVDPCDLAGETIRVLGDNYTAELWFAPGENRSEGDLTPVAFVPSVQLDPFGEMRFGAGRKVLGVGPGELVTLQLRVWDNQAGSIASWSDATQSTTSAFGSSEMIGNYQLGGFLADGTPVLAVSMFRTMSPITISIVCPEPSSYLLLALGAGCGLFIRRRGAGVTK